MSNPSITRKETKNASSSSRYQSGARSAPHPKRPEVECRAGYFGRIEYPARRHVRSVSEDEELSLAHVWSTFPRLSPFAGRARRPDTAVPWPSMWRSRHATSRRCRVTSTLRWGPTLRSSARPPADGSAVEFVAESDDAQVSEIVQRVRDGRLRTNIGNVSTLDDAVTAFNPTERRRGKTIIRVRP